MVYEELQIDNLRVRNMALNLKLVDKHCQMYILHADFLKIMDFYKNLSKKGKIYKRDNYDLNFNENEILTILNSLYYKKESLLNHTYLDKLIKKFSEKLKEK